MRSRIGPMGALIAACLSGICAVADQASVHNKRAITTQDIVELTGIGSQPHAYAQKGVEQDVDVRSPDGTLTAVVIRKGSIACNCNDYTLQIYRTAELLQRPHAQVLLRWSSTSNRPAISSLQWLHDNRTLAFLGERRGELPQVYTVRIDTQQVVSRTAEKTVVTGYKIDVDDSWLIVEVERARDNPHLAEMRRNGFVVKPTMYVGDIVAGDWSGLAPNWSEGAERELVVLRKGEPPRRLRSPIWHVRTFPEISADGRHALFMRRGNARPPFTPPDFTRLDLTTGEEVFVKREAAVKEPPEAAAYQGPKLVLDYDLNRPTRLLAQDARTGRRAVVIDPTPEIAQLRLTAVQVVRGKLPNGRQWTGGLYLPPDAVAGRRYPLVIQTHGFDDTVFAPQGIGPSGNAAQPLAARGIAVLQFEEKSMIELSEFGTTAELPSAMAGYEAAVRYLSDRGQIDPARVGLQGWSRTGQFVYYTLQHSDIPFAAAFISDAQTAGYYEKLSVQNVQRSYAQEGEMLFGAQPQGAGLMKWAEHSPGFNMHLIRAPIRLEFYGSELAPFMWEAYANLLELRKPVELFIIPDGAHVLVKPAEQLASANAMVDWFDFWLNGREDPDAKKAEQYARWRGYADPP